MNVCEDRLKKEIQVNTKLRNKEIRKLNSVSIRSILFKLCSIKIR